MCHHEHCDGMTWYTTQEANASVLQVPGPSWDASSSWPFIEHPVSLPNHLSFSFFSNDLVILTTQFVLCFFSVFLSLSCKSYWCRNASTCTLPAQHVLPRWHSEHTDCAQRGPKCIACQRGSRLQPLQGAENGSRCVEQPGKDEGPH